MKSLVRKNQERKAAQIAQQHGEFLTDDTAKEIAKAIGTTQEIVRLARSARDEAADIAQASARFYQDR